MKEPQGELSNEDLIRIADDINEFFTAFDKILSRIAFGTASSELLVQYIQERSVGIRLAEMRRLLFGLVEARLGEEAADAIGEGVFDYFPAE